jgi:hypothetical protein
VLDAAAARSPHLDGRPLCPGLVIQEMPGGSVFRHLRDGHRVAGGWAVSSTGDGASLRAWRGDGARVLLFAGRQVATAEGMEVLSLLSDRPVPDGLPLPEAVSAVRAAGGIPVIPWGLGKWLLGRRRALVAYLRGAELPLFLGDSGHRPRSWPEAGVFAAAAARGVLNLPGSDPLPLRGEEGRAGSLGFLADIDPDSPTPGHDLRRHLMSLRDQPPLVGNGRGWGPILRSQIALRLAKRRDGGGGNAARDDREEQA